MIKRFLTISMLAGFIHAAPDTGITMREGGIVRADACVLAMDFETGIADDLSGNENNGTIFGATHVPATKTVSGAFRLDGVNDYIRVSDIDETEGTNQLSVCCWVKCDIMPADYPSAGQGYVAKFDTGKSWILYGNAGLTQAQFRVYQGGASYRAVGNSILDKNWHHYCGIYNGANVILYDNGIEQPTKAVFTGNITIGNSYITIGSYQLSTDYFNGSIDEVLIYNYYLTPSEVNDLYHAGMIRHPNP